MSSQPNLLADALSFLNPDVLDGLARVVDCGGIGQCQYCYQRSDAAPHRCTLADMDYPCRSIAADTFKELAQIARGEKI